MRQFTNTRPLPVVAALAVALLACERTPPRAIPGIPHAGFRTDIADSLRGNATFESATITRDGRWLVTTHLNSPDLRAWDAHSGALVARIRAGVDQNEPWLVDGASQRLVAHRPGGAGLSVFDLRSGAFVGDVGDSAASPAAPLGVAHRTLVVARAGAIETWSLDSLVRTSHVEVAALGAPPRCIGGMPFTYHDRHCWELSGDARWLAIAFTAGTAPDAPTRFVLVDLVAATAEELALPDGAPDRYIAAFAYSSDGARLAVGTDRGVWLRNIAAHAWGTRLEGRHARNPYLGALAFNSDDARLVTLGDQLQLSTFDVADGRLVGQANPPDWDKEGILRLSTDGRRAVVYHFVADVLEVMDATTMTHIGWVCPYFCNTKHNPVPVAFALSPDGRVLAASHRYGAALWDPAADRVIAPLRDPTLPPLPPR